MYLDYLDAVVDYLLIIFYLNFTYAIGINERMFYTL